MTRKQLIATVESMHPDLSYSKDQILEMVEQLDELPVIDKGDLLISFMNDDNTLFDINDVGRILNAHKGVEANDLLVDVLVRRFEKIVSEKAFIERIVLAMQS